MRSASSAETLRLSARSADSRYGHLPAVRLNVSVFDDDVVGVSIGSKTRDFGLGQVLHGELAEGEGEFSYSIWLDSEPLGWVNISVSVAHDAAPWLANATTRAVPSWVVFNASNWNVGQQPFAFACDWMMSHAVL